MSESHPPLHPDKTLFYEQQYFRQTWVMLIFLVCLLLVIVLPLNDLQNEPERRIEIIRTTALSSALILVAMFAIRRLSMQLWVLPDGIHIRYWPLIRQKVISFAEIERHEAVTYRPIMEYGGWGIRGFAGHMAYNVSGNHGVKLWLRGNKTLMLGSQRADELTQAISNANN